MYYHGSQTLITSYLEPRRSNVLGGKSAVFATDKKWLALFFIANTTDLDFDIGFYRDKPYILEQNPGAIDRKLKGVSGYLYSVKKAHFIPDVNLGMQQSEFISPVAVPIVKTTKIPNIYKALKKEKIPIVSFEQKMDLIYDKYLR